MTTQSNNPPASGWMIAHLSRRAAPRAVEKAGAENEDEPRAVERADDEDEIGKPQFPYSSASSFTPLSLS
jgi:hypothetical protein